MKLDASILTVLLFIGGGVGLAAFVKSDMVYVPVLTDVARNSRPQPATAHFWPPQRGQVFPEMRLTGLSGDPVKLSDYRGRVLLIEAIAMDCKACQSFSGGNDYGPFGDADVQPGLESLETYVQRFAGVDFEDPRLLYVQVLFFDLESRRPPTIEEARAWAEHFHLNRPNVLVAIAHPDYLSRDARKMIPGFHLVDQNFRLRIDAGRKPRQDLYKELLPALGKLLSGEPLIEGEPLINAEEAESAGDPA